MNYSSWAEQLANYMKDWLSSCEYDFEVALETEDLFFYLIVRSVLNQMSGRDLSSHEVVSSSKNIRPQVEARRFNWLLNAPQAQMDASTSAFSSFCDETSVAAPWCKRC